MLLRRSRRGDELVVNDEMPIGLKILNVFKNIVAANSHFMGYSRGGGWESIYMAESHYSLPAMRA